MNYLSEIDDPKRTEEGRIFQNKCVSSQQIPMRKEEGATVAATPTFSRAKQCGLVSQGQNGPRFSTEITLQEAPIKYRKCPTFDAKRRRFSDSF
jgi:hypothetical protein